jgi:hypothetical protein
LISARQEKEHDGDDERSGGGVLGQEEVNPDTDEVEVTAATTT